MTKTIDDVYNDFWKDIVEVDGELDKEQIKRELFDYYVAIREVGKVYDELTMGAFTKPNTAAEYVINRVYKVLCEED